MFLRKNNLLFAIVAGLLILSGFSVYGQSQSSGDAVSDESLGKFTEALVEVQAIQQEVNTTIDSVIEESELSSEKFFEIYDLVLNDPEAGDQIADEARKPFEEIMEEVTVLQNDMQKDMVESVQKTGLTVEEFNSIFALVQQEPALQNRMESLMN